MRIYDLSQHIENGMTHVPGDPFPQIARVPCDPPWQVSRLKIGTHTGTHLDAPSHLSLPTTLTDLPLERFIGPGIVLDVSGKQPGEMIELADLGPAPEVLQQGNLRAIFRTGWDRYWGTDEYFAHPKFDPGLATALANWHVPLVGVDTLNPDDTATGDSEVHEVLLGAGVLIVENLTGLEQLEAGRIYTFSFLPLKLAGLDGAPVRAIAWD